MRNHLKKLLLAVMCISAVLIGVYANSADMVKERAYRKGKAQADAGNFAEAEAILIGLKDYKDTASLIAGNPGLSSSSSSSSAADAELERKWSVRNTVTYGAYEQDNVTGNGKEPIRWRVLKREGQKALLISEMNLERQPYDTSYSTVTWETCTLRTWLNSTFLDTAFSPAQQGAILTTTVRNEDNPKYSTDGGNSTQDRLFLMSIAEAEILFNGYADRKGSNTPYVSAQGAYDDDGYGWWWLRSPGFDLSSAAFVGTDGSVSRYGNGVSFSYNAVRPALWLDLASDIVTFEAP